MTSAVFDSVSCSIKEENRVIFELPRGKIGKDGEVTLQKGQKERTCLFYAIKRLLTPEQIRSPHGVACSLRRKMVVEGTRDAFSREEIYLGSEKADAIFLRSKGIDPERAGREVYADIIKFADVPHIPAEVLTPAVMEKIIAMAEPRLAEADPHYRITHIRSAADREMARGHGLKEVPYEQIATMEGLLTTLKTRGPLLVGGQFGKSFYMGAEPIKLREKIGDHDLYGWRKGTPGTLDRSCYYAIILVGAEVKEGKEYVYWIDVADPSDPETPGGQRWYVSSFNTIISQMGTLIGIRMAELNPVGKAKIPVALYNPHIKV